MTAGVARGDGVLRGDARWKWLLWGLCLLSFIVVITVASAVFGVGGRPWFGWWDALHSPNGQPYTLVVAGVRPDGASALAGMRTGDRIDLRDLSLGARMGVIFQPLATRPIVLRVSRGSRSLDIRVQPSTGWENAPLWKMPPMFVANVTNVGFFLCGSLIALRRWWNRDARVLALVLIFLTFTAVAPINFVSPVPGLNLALFAVASVAWCAAFVLLIGLSARFGARSASRRALEVVAYGATGLIFLFDIATIVGLGTLRVDPLPFAYVVSPLRSILELIALLVVVTTVTVAVAATPAAQRPRAAWLLLPLPVAFASQEVALLVGSFATAWFPFTALVTLGLGCVLVGAIAVTYALLKRRVLDFEFVLSRTLVVATVSLIVVASFALLEWILGTVLAGVSHATGLIANGALALILGLSLNPIHRRVDDLVDKLLFRKRHDDERALREFSKEAAFVTESDALLDRTIDTVHRHTDARSAALLLNGSTTYSAVRSFGGDGDGAATRIGENDGAILALKAWHKPIDPHHYGSGVQGALALPMLVRGRLLGVLVMGERAGGEAYAPDEVEALAAVAHGVGTAMDGLASHHASGTAQIAAVQQQILDELRQLPAKIAGAMTAKEDHR
jgi:GAF domain